MKKIEHHSLPEQVYHRLFEQIIAGKLPEGSRLTEENICNSLGVSRTPAREALTMLCRDKLAERIPRCGCSVKKFDCEEAKELFECRRMLECLALGEGFARINHEELLDLKNKLEKYEDNRKKSLELDEELHELIIRACPNRHLQEVVRQTVKRTKPLRSWRSFKSMDIKAVNSERLEIIAALLSGNREKSIALLAKHIMQGIVNIPKD
jgi:DNA-binding GntR family transcriptional regulator